MPPPLPPESLRETSLSISLTVLELSESMPPPLPPTQGARLWMIRERRIVSGASPRSPTTIPPPSPSASVLFE